MKNLIEQNRKLEAGQCRKHDRKLVNQWKETRLGYAVSKFLAFLIIYMVSAVLMEGIIILILQGMGYDALHGEVPQGISQGLYQSQNEFQEMFAGLLPLYGFIGFAVVTILYMHCIEKRPWKEYGIIFSGKTIRQFLRRAIEGAILVAIIILLLVSLQEYQFAGIHYEREQGQWVLLTLGAYLIQGSTEELMCRGFLQNSLCAKINEKTAILITAIVFMIPHLGSIITMDGGLAAIAVANVILVSILFSLVMIKDHNLLSACGLHIGWNYMLGSIMGLQVSGGTVAADHTVTAGQGTEDSVAGIIQMQLMNSGEKVWLTGGAYGIEASVMLTITLLILDAFIINKIRSLRKSDRGLVEG